MKNKIIVCMVVTLLFTIAIPLTGMAEKRIMTVCNNDGDFLDQYQNTTNDPSDWPITRAIQFAQSFTPRFNILTRVQLYLYTMGNPSEKVNVTVSIRESLKGKDLTVKTLTRNELPMGSYWVEFNFKDIAITPHNLYYIVCNSSNVDERNSYCWYHANNNPYKNGVRWYSTNGGATWSNISTSFDMCFRTYGLQDNPPITPTITGETNGDIQTLYDYTIQTTDPDQDNVQYFIDWGDNTTTTTGLNESGANITVSHMWNTKGTYSVKVKAIDEHGLESDWATLKVTMPYSYIKQILQFLELLFQRFPNAFPLLRHLLQ